MRLAALAHRRDLEADVATEGVLMGTSTQAVIASLRMPAQDIVRRMKDEPPFNLGKAAGDDGRLEQIMYLALKPDRLWNTMQSFNEMKVIIASLMMGLSLTMLLMSRPTQCGEWTEATCRWLGVAADWVSFLSFLLFFRQLFASFSSGRVLATVPPHRLHEFMAESTSTEPRTPLNMENDFTLGILVLFASVGLHFLLLHPGIQGIIEAVACPLLCFWCFLGDLRKLSWRTRVLWGLGWGHVFLNSTLARESTLDRIGQAASDLADDIEAAVGLPCGTGDMAC